MTAVRVILPTVFVVAVAVSPASADPAPLRLEELQARSQLILTGQVESHYERDQEERDGTMIRNVTMTVLVQTVEKGEKHIQAGQRIECRCWVVVRDPPSGVVLDPGQRSVPGMNGRARFYIDYHDGSAWHIMHPNGIELLDSTPPMRYERTPASMLDRVLANASVWVITSAAAVIAIGLGALYLLSGKVRARQ